MRVGLRGRGDSEKWESIRILISTKEMIPVFLVSSVPWLHPITSLV